MNILSPQLSSRKKHFKILLLSYNTHALLRVMREIYSKINIVFMSENRNSFSALASGSSFNFEDILLKEYIL